MTFKDNDNSITIKCGCEMVFIRPDKTIKIIKKRDYDTTNKERQ